MTDILPHNPQAEEALIGSVLLNPSSIYELPTDAKEFYLHRHRHIWQAYRNLQESNIAIDYVTVMEELERMSKLGEVGGAAYITKTLNSVPSSLHALEYANSVRDAYIRRDTLELSRQLTTAAFSDTRNIIVERSDIAQALTEVQGMSGAVHISEWMSKLYDQIGEWILNPRASAGVSTSLVDLDQVLGDGLMTGVNLLGGKPGLGKSILAQNIAENMIDDNVPVVLYSAEMTWLDMSLRILSKRVSVTVRDIRRGNIPEDKNDLIVYEIEKINKLPFYVLDPKGMTTAELRADLVRLKAQHGIQVCIFDYLELLGDEYPRLKDWERAARLVRKLVLMMTKLDLKALIIQKLNKEGWDGTPDLKHFAGGSDVSYDVVSALVMVEHIPETGDSDGNMRTLINVKPQRLIQETRKACNLYKHPDYPLFSLAAPKSAHEYREYAR